MGFGIKSAFKKVKKTVKKVGDRIGDAAKDALKGGINATKAVGQVAVGDFGGAARSALAVGKSAADLTNLDSLVAKPPSGGAEMEALVMPDIDAEAVARARRRAAAMAMKSGGRASTILTGGSGSLIG